MNTKYLFTAIAVVVVLVIGLFIYNQKNKQSDVSSDTNTVSNENTENSVDNSNTADLNANVDVNANTNSVTSTPKESTTPDGNDVAVFNVTYDGTAFSPSSLTIKNGDVVIFKNTGDSSFWPASDPHPTHTNYPEFDAKKAIPAGQTYQFKFTKTGTWGYHNHLNPAAHGTIIVK
ncbi:MAG TPA: cupredoxin domain-containing protein [Patescibacteria group bacterium]|jgi:plastocyanin|nr:cupredoxin domain-containing protein [Patescibacteria group bacterium]